MNEKRMEGTVPFWFEFLDLYKSCRCLWDTEHQSYRNWEAKKEAYELLLEKYKEINPRVTVEIVRKKVDSFRSGWRREEKKVRESLKNSTRIEDIHVPVLWFYNKLTFLSNTEEEVQRRRREAELSTEVEIEINDLKAIVEADSSSTTSKIATASNYDPGTPELEESVYSWSPPSKKIKTEGKLIEEGEIKSSVTAIEDGEINTIAANHREENLEEEEDEDLAYSKYLKTQMRQLTEKQKLIAQKLISDVIFLARTDQLSYETKVNNSSNAQPPAPAPVPAFNPTPPIIITLPVNLASALIPNANTPNFIPDPAVSQTPTVPTTEANNPPGELPVIQNSFSFAENSDTKQENGKKESTKLRKLLEPKPT